MQYVVFSFFCFLFSFLKFVFLPVLTIHFFLFLQWFYEMWELVRKLFLVGVIAVIAPGRYVLSLSSDFFVRFLFFKCFLVYN